MNSKGPSFSDILRKKMTEEAEPTSEHMNDLAEQTKASRHLDPAHLAFLLGEVSTYRATQQKCSSKFYRPQPRRPHQFNESQQRAYEYFLSLDINLPRGYNLTELKSSFRKAALKLHPDTADISWKSKGTEELTRAFMELKANFKILSEL